MMGKPSKLGDPQSPTTKHFTRCAPIALFVYNRLDHVKQTVESLRTNDLAGDSDLVIFSDAARSADTRLAVDEVRSYLATISGFRSVTVKERSSNLGLAQSITRGVQTILQDSDRVIVLEDDMVTSRHFLTYMNEALERYAEDARVVSIHGYRYPVKQSLPEAFFLPGADCWGWATWRRGWALFNPDGQYLLNELKRRDLVQAFNFNDGYPFSQLLQAQTIGQNDSWAIRWYASAFLAGKLTLYPGRSLVHNIGNDGTGTHSRDSSQFDSSVSETKIKLGNIAVTPSEEARKAFESFFKKNRRRQTARALSLRVTRIARAIAKDWFPPAVQRFVKAALDGRDRTLFEGDFGSWAEASRVSTGYSDPQILQRVLTSTEKVLLGHAAFERDSVPFRDPDHAWSVLAGIMWGAARNGRLDVLDVGGSLGSSYFQTREFTADLPDVAWSIIEQPHFVAAAKETGLEGYPLRFYRSVEDCLGDGRQPNVVLLSSVLQYLESPDEVIASISKIGADILIVDRTPFSTVDRDTILVQRVDPAIYVASYPMWVFSSAKFRERVDSDWRLIAAKTSPEGSVRSKEGLRFLFEDMIFEARR